MQEKRSFRWIKFVIAFALISVLALGIISASAATELNLQFDDYYDVEGKTVEIVDKGTPTSFKVGYNVAAGTKDDAVITLSDDKKDLIATGIGTAKVKIDGVDYNVTVTPAPLSILLLIGQSNMRGSEGDPNQSIVCPDGKVYSTYGEQNDMDIDNASSYAPSALTGELSNTNVNGNRYYLNTHPVYALTDRGTGKLGADSGIGYEWANSTNEKVWIVNAAHGGTESAQWLRGGQQYKECLPLFNACLDTFEKEIAAGHFTFSHMAYYWCQGCAGQDANEDAEWYVNRFLEIHNNLKEDFKLDHDANPATPKVTFEMAGIIPIRGGSYGGSTSYRQGTYANGATAPQNDSYYTLYFDLVMKGPRVAQYWLGASAAHPDIYNICTIQFDWAIMPDGSDPGVKKYFQAHYPNGTVDYKTQIKQSESWHTPTKTADVHDTIHYNQIGYNEIGRESARNTLYILGLAKAPDSHKDITVEFVSWDGFTNVSEMEGSFTGQSSTLAVPLIYPAYKAKEVTFKTTDGLNYHYYDLLTTAFDDGELTVEGAKDAPKIKVTNKAMTSPFSWKLQDGKLVSVGDTENKATLTSGSFNGTNFTNQTYELQHNIYLVSTDNWNIEWEMEGKWYTSTNPGLKKLFSKSPLMKAENEEIFMINGKQHSLSFGVFDGKTELQYGICLADHGIDMSKKHVYKLENRVEADGTNMIYLFVDGKEIGAMNNVLENGIDTGKDDNWVNGRLFIFRYLGVDKYPLTMGVINYLDYTPGHDHVYTDKVVAPTCVEKGYTEHVCGICGDTIVDTYVDATGVHTYDNDNDADCNSCGATRTVEATPAPTDPAPTDPTTPSESDPEQTDPPAASTGGCSCSNSSALAVFSLLLCAQLGVFFKKKRS